jgi:arginyl-tRNA synthetase
VYLELQNRLADHLRAVLKQKYDLEMETIPLEIPPDLKFGELSTPIAFELARKLRKAPKMIAAEIVAALGTQTGFASFEVAGAGYINARLDRAVVVKGIVGGDESPVSESRPGAPGDSQVSEARPGAPGDSTVSESRPGAPGGLQVHSLVEHTSINPNKAAHIGHLRNAILGDTFVRLLRAAGQKVDVQNYIDNTGVQVADVVVGFQHLEGMGLVDVRALLAELERKGERIDFYCWDLYAKTSAWYEQGSAEENEARKKLRYATLHAIEEGGNDTAEVAELISTAVLRRHLETMLRLDIEYDFLPRESEILHLKFWDAAFEQMKRTGVLYFETEGKNKGCWVMTRPGAEITEGETNEDAKVIVRSNGTVTYVGKDIAYHLWKFGLLGKDFGYKPFFTYPDHECWISAAEGVEPHPQFGGAQAIYNVIDARQSDPQANVIQALRGMGYTAQADRYTHFSYEMVALTPRCAVDLGYTVSAEDMGRSYIEVSGRKGFGVKADDLMDKLITAARAEVDARQTGGAGPDADVGGRRIAEQIAIGALRYFMLKFTRNSVIAFDFKDALSFEGETGPYIQYAVVRARNIFRKAGLTPAGALEAFTHSAGDVQSALEDEDIWSLWLRAGRRTMVLEQCIAASEPAYLAKHAFQLAQEFNNFYHKHHILTEEDAARKALLLATAAVALRELIEVLSWLGIESPEAM